MFQLNQVACAYEQKKSLLVLIWRLDKDNM